MSTEEMTMKTNVTAIYPSAVSAKSETEAKSAHKTRVSALRCALSSLVALAGCGGMAFGFWMLAERQKNLGFIDVLIALAVVAGAAVAACGIASLVRTVKDRRDSAK